jgi:hypothetical protein
MKVVHKLATVGAGLAAAGLTVAATASGSHASSSQADTSIEKTRTIIGQPMTFLQTQFIPQVMCPVDAPYVLNQQYNQGSGFRINPGIEFSDYKSGFDAAVSTWVPDNHPERPGKTIAKGIGGSDSVFENTVTYWGVETTGWKLTLHCTSDLNKAWVPAIP